MKVEVRLEARCLGGWLAYLVAYSPHIGQQVAIWVIRYIRRFYVQYRLGMV